VPEGGEGGAEGDSLGHAGPNGKALEESGRAPEGLPLPLALPPPPALFTPLTLSPLHILPPLLSPPPLCPLRPRVSHRTAQMPTVPSAEAVAASADPAAAVPRGSCLPRGRRGLPRGGSWAGEGGGRRVVEMQLMAFLCAVGRVCWWVHCRGKGRAGQKEKSGQRGRGG